MADITKCSGEECANKDTCYRFTATANPHWQSVFIVAPLKGDKTCSHYWLDESVPVSNKLDSGVDSRQ